MERFLRNETTRPKCEEEEREDPIDRFDRSKLDVNERDEEEDGVRGSRNSTRGVAVDNMMLLTHECTNAKRIRNRAGQSVVIESKNKPAIAGARN